MKILSGIAEKITAASATNYNALYKDAGITNSWHTNIEAPDSTILILGLRSLGFQSLYADADYSNKLKYNAISYNYPDANSICTVDYIINETSLGKIATFYDGDSNASVSYRQEFVSKNMTWPLYGVMAYMNAIGSNPNIITAKYDKYNKLYDMSYNTDYARAGDHSNDSSKITVSNSRLAFNNGNKYAKPMIFSVINKNDKFGNDDIKYGDFKIRIRNVQIPMRTFRMSDHRYVVIAPEYLFTSRDQYDAITCIEYTKGDFNTEWAISYSYATSPNDGATGNQKMYPAIPYSTSNAFNLSVMTSSLR